MQEFQVVSNNYSAEFGHATGGVVNTVTRSPTAGQNGLPRPIYIARTNWPRKLQQRAYWSRECLESKDRAG